MTRTLHNWHKTLKILAVLIFFLFAFQFLAGMEVNLYYGLHPEASAARNLIGVIQVIGSGLTGRVWSLQVHMIMGILFVVTASVFLGFSIASRRKGWIATALCGWAGTVGASFNGASFLIHGQVSSSLLMAIGFLAAGISYSIGLLSSLFIEDR